MPNHLGIIFLLACLLVGAPSGAALAAEQNAENSTRSGNAANKQGMTVDPGMLMNNPQMLLQNPEILAPRGKKADGVKNVSGLPEEGVPGITVYSYRIDPLAYLGKEFIVEGEFMGLTYDCPSDPGIPKVVEQWVLKDVDCVYIKGPVPEGMDVRNPQGERLLVYGVGKTIENEGYIEAKLYKRIGKSSYNKGEKASQ